VTRVKKGLTLLLLFSVTRLVVADYVEEVLRDNPMGYWRLGEQQISEALTHLFLGSTPHVLDKQCAEIPTCPDRCLGDL